MKLSKFFLAIFTSAIAFSASADPIEIVALTDGNHPSTLGDYTMTPFVAPSDGYHSCTTSSFGQDVCFDDGG